MRYKVIPQEGLKLIACMTMLLDHVGAALWPSVWLRIIGRLSFPIYCFLLTEGIYHTRSPKKYLCRLASAAVLSEIPFDLLFYGRLTLQAQSVMLTLFLGAAMLLAIRRTTSGPVKTVWILLACIAAELLQTDYGSTGILLIALFGLTHRLPVQLAGMALPFIRSAPVAFWGVPVPIGLFALLSLIPICLYSGKKQTSSKWVQRGFYVFYPAHMLLLLLLKISQ